MKWWLLLLLSPVLACAHDPGMSSATVDLGSRDILVQLAFAPADLAPREIGPEQAAASFELRDATSRIAATSVEVRKAGTDNIEFTLRFPRPITPTTFRSTLLASLPFGHRQAVTIRDTAGAVVLTDLLSAEHDSVTLPTNLRDGSFPASGRESLARNLGVAALLSIGMLLAVSVFRRGRAKAARARASATFSKDAAHPSARGCAAFSRDNPVSEKGGFHPPAARR